ncbi:hypothetical protein BDV93DRAFT_541556 [Ceratobasidium sp. AG-I]|nr:hypothetical protein BDV93DRAFT_541556 [Ceratobasidium sp. AG-I]
MVYSNSVIPLTLLLSASGVTVSAAATIPWNGGRGLSIHVCTMRFSKSNRDASLVDSINPSIIHSRSVRPGRGVIAVRRMADLIGASPNDAGSPVRITTTKEVSRIEAPSQSSEIPGLGVPSNSPEEETMSITKAKSNSQLDPKKLIHGGIQGFLNIVATTDEDPNTLRIASLGFPNDNIGDNPFEIGSESEDGSIVYLVPTKPSDISLVSLVSQVSNDTMAMIVARSSFSGAIPSLNMTDSQPPSANTASSPITVRLKADVTDVESQESDELCVTYNSNWDQIQDEPPMRLKHCDDSYIPGASSSSGSSSETQLWQYDPETRELRPLVLGLASEAAAEAPMNPSTVVSATAPLATSAEVEVMTSPPSASGVASSMIPSAVAGKIDMPHGSAHNAPAQGGPSSSSAILQDGDKGPAAQKNAEKPATPRPPKPNSAAQKQDATTRSLMAIVPVDPYTLLFSPRSAARRASLIPRPPA